MDRNTVYLKVNEIFKDAFGRDDLIINDETKATDIEGWDSLMQINLIEMIEDEFEIKFSMDEVIGLENVGDIINRIEEKI